MTEPIYDERVRFYAQRRALIDEWIAAAKAEPRVVAEFLGGIASFLQKSAGGWDLEGRPRVYRAKANAGLYLPGWLGLDGVPRAFIGLGWVPAEVRFEGEETAFVGVRARKSKGHEHTRQMIQETLAANGPAFGFGASETVDELWPLYSYVPCVPEDEYWNDLEPYRARLLGEVRDAWERAWRPLDVAIREAGDLPSD